jgi:hypothetical protein
VSEGNGHNGNGHNGDNGAEKPFTKGDGRESNGRFAKGWKGGPGNPALTRVTLLKGALLTSLSESDIVAAVGVLRSVITDEKCRPGERVAAAKELLDRAVGRPPQAVDLTSGGQPLYKGLEGVSQSDL